jgi:hypothetical protein
VTERTVQGTLKGRFAWLPPANKEFTAHVADVWQPTADGKLAHGWTYGNLAEVALQTGAMKPPPEKAPAPAAAKRP